MHKFSRSAMLVMGVSVLASLPAFAEEPRYNQVSLQAQASQDVARDLMIVTLYSEAQDSDPGKLAASVTQTINKALGQAREVKAVSVRQGSRNSYPVYDEKGQQITGWRERAELRLESADFAALSKLTGELLQDLKMGGMNFSIAPATRKSSEDALVKQAIAAFKARAQLATEAMGGSSYKIVNLSLNGGGYRPEPPVPMMMKASRGMADAVTPVIEAGTSQVDMNADGTIEVQMPTGQ